MKDKVKREALETAKSERQTVRLIFSKLTSGGVPATKSPTAVTVESVKLLVWVWAMLKTLDCRLKVKTNVPPKTPLNVYGAEPKGLPPE